MPVWQFLIILPVISQNNNRNRYMKKDDVAPPLPPKSPRSPKGIDGSLPPPIPARNYQV